MDKGLSFRQKCVPKADIFTVRRLTTGRQQTGRTKECKVACDFVVTSETLQRKQRSVDSGKTKEEALQRDLIVQKSQQTTDPFKTNSVAVDFEKVRSLETEEA